MNFLLTAIVAVLVFGTVVLVHEAGHFFAARHCGIHVEEFSIGFGPALWSTVRGGTRYSVRLLPLGGYNNLAGETPEESEDPDEQERAEPAKKQDAAAASVHTYDPHAPLFPLTVDGKSFVEASPWQRFFVIAAGALMNFVLGFILLLVLVASGSAVTSKIIYDFQGENPKSQASGLQVNDEIMSVNRHFCFTAEDVMYELQRTENDTATICGTASWLHCPRCSLIPLPMRTAQPPWYWISGCMVLKKRRAAWCMGRHGISAIMRGSSCADFWTFSPGVWASMSFPVRSV